MKKLFVLSLSMSSVAFISGGDFTFKPLLSSIATDTPALQWQNKNLTVDDFKEDGTAYPQVTSLDLSNNSFRGEFPLSSCLQMFPNLKTLTLNDNPNMTGFEIEKTYKNTILACISAENSGIAIMKLGLLYKNFDVTTLDLSRSAQLADFALEGVPSRSSRGTLQVHLRDVVIPEEKWVHKKIVVSSSAKENIVIGMMTLFGSITVPLFEACVALAPNYCVQGPIPPFQYDYMSPRNWANGAINTIALGGLIIASGVYVGNKIASCCLPNQGKVTMVQFITNSADDVV